jgi:hypothetical protein
MRSQGCRRRASVPGRPSRSFDDLQEFDLEDEGCSWPFRRRPPAIAVGEIRGARNSEVEILAFPNSANSDADDLASPVRYGPTAAARRNRYRDL